MTRIARTALGLAVSIGLLTLTGCTTALPAGTTPNTAAAAGFDFNAALQAVLKGKQPALPALDRTRLTTVAPFTISGNTMTLKPEVKNAWLRVSGSQAFVNADGKWYQANLQQAAAGYRTAADAPIVLNLVGNDQDNFLGVDSENADQKWKVTVDGGAGNDAESIADTKGGIAAGSELHGGDGADTLAVEGGGCVVDGGAGNDTAYGSSGTDALKGGDGDDKIYAGGGNDTVNGGAGADLLAGGVGNDAIEGGLGNDTLLGGADTDTLNGGDGNDSIDGGLGNDVLAGEAGNDKLEGGDGDDRIAGGDGFDVCLGEGGSDLVEGGLGDDKLDGGAGDDVLEGKAGDDLLIGGLGNDVAVGGGGADKLEGGDGNDTLCGDAYVGASYAGPFTDFAYDTAVVADSADATEENADLIEGGLGDDTLQGGADGDYLVGGDGNDAEVGGSGNDELIGGGGNDTLDGGAGTDGYFDNAGDSNTIAEPGATAVTDATMVPAEPEYAEDPSLQQAETLADPDTVATEIALVEEEAAADATGV